MFKWLAKLLGPPRYEAEIPDAAIPLRRTFPPLPEPPDPLRERKPGTTVSQFLIRVAGVSFRNDDGSSRQNALISCLPGERAILISEPNNPHDRDAVKVCTADDRQVGYLPRDHGLAAWVQLGDVSAMFLSAARPKRGTPLGALLRITKYHEPPPTPEERAAAKRLRAHEKYLERKARLARAKDGDLDRPG